MLSETYVDTDVIESSSLWRQYGAFGGARLESSEGSRCAGVAGTSENSLSRAECRCKAVKAQEKGERKGLFDFKGRYPFKSLAERFFYSGVMIATCCYKIVSRGEGALEGTHSEE